METKMILFPVLFSLLFAGNIHAQLTVSIDQNGHEMLLQKDTSAKLTAFSGKYNSEKVYLNWKVTSLHKDGIFLIYRSVDGVNYENIGSKQGIGVPNPIAIAYDFTDENPPGGKVYYKILYVDKNNMYIISDKTDVISQNTHLTAGK